MFFSMCISIIIDSVCHRYNYIKFSLFVYCNVSVFFLFAILVISSNFPVRIYKSCDRWHVFILLCPPPDCIYPPNCFLTVSILYSVSWCFSMTLLQYLCASSFYLFCSDHISYDVLCSSCMHLFYNAAVLCQFVFYNVLDNSLTKCGHYFVVDQWPSLPSIISSPPGSPSQNDLFVLTWRYTLTK